MEEPAVPDLRASDADRERTAETVRRAAGVGQLDLEELDQRLESVYAARTGKELERLTADLAPIPEERAAALPVRPGEGGTRWVVSVMGGSDRKGHWRVGRSVTVLNLMGGSNLDLNDAEFAGDVVEMRVYSLMGGSEIRVPDGLDVEVSEFAFMGGNDVSHGEAGPRAGGPKLRLKMISIMGGTTVHRGRKKSRAERRLERERRKHLGH